MRKAWQAGRRGLVGSSLPAPGWAASQQQRARGSSVEWTGTHGRDPWAIRGKAKPGAGPLFSRGTRILTGLSNPSPAVGRVPRARRAHPPLARREHRSFCQCRRGRRGRTPPRFEAPVTEARQRNRQPRKRVPWAVDDQNSAPGWRVLVVVTL
jgi:hypothetical protein